jgi:hypothetical protein
LHFFMTTMILLRDIRLVDNAGVGGGDGGRGQVVFPGFGLAWEKLLLYEYITYCTGTTHRCRIHWYKYFLHIAHLSVIENSV